MTALIAREKELATASAALERADAGRGRLIVVSGEPGIGKSALASSITEAAERRKSTVVLGRAWELAEAPPYFPLRPCLASIGVTLPDDASIDAFRLWELVLPALARASSERLVTWIIEDIHAADLGTLDLLALLAQPLGTLRVVIVVTTRMQDPRITDRVRQRLTRMARDGLDIRLDPLAPKDATLLAERIAGRSLSAAISSRIAEITGGNPLFIVECARSVPRTGAPMLSQSLRQITMERVELLPDATKQALNAASILGREAHAGMVARMLEKLPAQIIDALDPALRAGILIELEPAHFAFAHILVRDAIEGALSGEARADLHARAARVLATMGEGPEVIVERARHALASLRDEEEAMKLAHRAAKLLEDGGASDRAYAMYQRIDAAHLPNAKPALGSEERLKMARLAQSAGRFAEAHQLCKAVIEEARRVNDAELLARAALLLGAHIQAGIVDPVLVQALETAHARLPKGSLALIVRARLAGALQPAPDDKIPVGIAREAIADARTLGDEATLLEVLFFAIAALVDAAPVEERLVLNRETLELALRAGDLPKISRTVRRLAIDQVELGQLEAWHETVDRALEASARLAHPRDRWAALLLASMRSLAQGDVAASDRAFVEVWSSTAINDDPGLLMALGAHALCGARLLHRDDEMRRGADEVIAHVRGSPYGSLISSSFRVGVFSRLEDVEATRTELAKLGAMGKGRPPAFGLPYDIFLAFSAEAYAFLGDVEACKQIRPIFEPVRDWHLCSGHVGMTYEGPIARLLALLDSAIGEHARAEEGLRTVLYQATARAYTPWIAQGYYDLGVALLRAKKDASVELERAATIAEEVGMPGLVQRARAKLVAPRSNIRPAPERSSFAMKREGDVWLVEHGDRKLRVKTTRGIELLARLVERRGEEIHVLALASDEAGASLFDNANDQALDARAKRELKERLDDLEDELAAAERDADRGRIATLQREKESLEAEISKTFSLGKGRVAGSPSERARVNVQRRLKDAIARIGELDPGVGRFLQKAVRSGTYCSFLF